MNNSKLIFYSVVNSIATFAYIALVAWIMFNGERFFGKLNGFSGPLVMLLLFVVSALVTGLLVLGRPTYFYLNGFRREGIRLLFYTLSCLIFITAVILALMML